MGRVGSGHLKVTHVQLWLHVRGMILEAGNLYILLFCNLHPRVFNLRNKQI